MPAFLTHWRVLIETAQRSQDAGSDLGSLIIDMSALRRRLGGMASPPQTTPAGAVWNTGPLPAIGYRFPGSDIASRLDEHLATTYFDRDLYSWISRPWIDYIEPAVKSLTGPLAAAIPTILATAAETTYTLTTQQSQAFQADFLTGIHSTLLYLA